MTKREMIKLAVDYQARDELLWSPQTIGEDYIVQALRDLHHVIEHEDKEALERIKDCMECSLK